jgi:peptide/nickel transport system ATP-binding protein
VSDPVLRVQDLSVAYATDAGSVQAVDGVSFTLSRGERFGLVGESGSGKSTTAWAIMRLIRPPGRIQHGSIQFESYELTGLEEAELRRLRLAQLALIPQGAMNSLNPVMRVRDQILDGARFHGKGAQDELAGRLPDLLSLVGLQPKVLGMYPHELSGGMKQRVSIAIAISLSPRLIIADEPTSALDVVVQRQIVHALASVQKRLQATILLVGHDMGLMAQFVDRIGVMYGGKLVEVGPVQAIFTEPKHPYTRLLISSLPSLRRRDRLRGIPGVPPSLSSPPPGCRFHPRCPRAFEPCMAVPPRLIELQPDHWAACHLY